MFAGKERMELATEKEIFMDGMKEKLRNEISDSFYEQLFSLSTKVCVRDEVEHFLKNPFGFLRQ